MGLHTFDVHSTNNNKDPAVTLSDCRDTPALISVLREGFIALLSFLIICIPFPIIHLCIKAFRYFAESVKEPVPPGSTTNWGWRLGAVANLIFALNATVFVAYISLFAPIVGVVILKRYFKRESDTVLRRAFSSFVVKYRLEFTAQTRVSVRDYYRQIASTGSAINSILLRAFALVALVSYVVVAFGWAIFALENSGLAFFVLLLASMGFGVGAVAVAVSLFKQTLDLCSGASG